MYLTVKACSKNWEKRNESNILVGIAEGKRLL
jgi:hypothetical protein